MNAWNWSFLIVAVIALAYVGAGFFGHGGFSGRRGANLPPADRKSSPGPESQATPDTHRRHHGCC